jgi:hypothetical protein
MIRSIIRRVALTEVRMVFIVKIKGKSGGEAGGGGGRFRTAHTVARIDMMRTIVTINQGFK